MSLSNSDLTAQFRLGLSAAADPTNRSALRGGSAVTTLQSSWLFEHCPVCAHSFRIGDPVLIDAEGVIRHDSSLLPTAIPLVLVTLGGAGSVSFIQQRPDLVQIWGSRLPGRSPWRRCWRSCWFSRNFASARTIADVGFFRRAFTRINADFSIRVDAHKSAVKIAEPIMASEPGTVATVDCFPRAPQVPIFALSAGLPGVADSARICFSSLVRLASGAIIDPD